MCVAEANQVPCEMRHGLTMVHVCIMSYHLYTARRLPSCNWGVVLGRWLVGDWWSCIWALDSSTSSDASLLPRWFESLRIIVGHLSAMLLSLIS